MLILLLYGQQVALLELGIYPLVQFSEQLFQKYVRNLYHVMQVGDSSPSKPYKQNWPFTRFLTAGHWTRWEKVLCGGRA